MASGGSSGRAARQSLVRAILAIICGDGDTLVDALLDLGFAGSGADRAGLRDDLTALFDGHLARPLGEISLAEVLRQAFAIARHR